MLFLIPAYLSEESPLEYFAPAVKEYILKTDYFFVENEKFTFIFQSNDGG